MFVLVTHHDFHSIYYLLSYTITYIKYSMSSIHTGWFVLLSHYSSFYLPVNIYISKFLKGR